MHVQTMQCSHGRCCNLFVFAPDPGTPQMKQPAAAGSQMWPALALLAFLHHTHESAPAHASEPAARHKPLPPGCPTGSCPAPHHVAAHCCWAVHAILNAPAAAGRLSRLTIFARPGRHMRSPVPHIKPGTARPNASLLPEAPNTQPPKATQAPWGALSGRNAATVSQHSSRCHGSRKDLEIFAACCSLQCSAAGAHLRIFFTQ